MKKGIIVNLKRFKLVDYVNYNKLFILILFLLVLGISLGSTVFIKNTSFSTKIKFLFDNILQTHSNNLIFKKFTVCFVKYLFILIIYFLFGTTMLGLALIPFAIIWQGIVTGAIVAYIYSLYGLMGIAFNAIIFIPPVTIFTVCCFFAAKYSINFSLCIARLTLPKYCNINLCIAFKNYCQRYAILILVSLICSIIEIIFNSLFLKFFNF